jgi:hypothetical protein
MTWIRHKKDDSLDPTGEFKKIDQLLPKKKGQKSKDRAKEIESALNWSRNNNTDTDEDAPAFNKLGPIPMSLCTPEDRQNDVDDVVTWLRNGKEDSEDPMGEFKKLDQILPQKRLQTPEDRAKDIEGVMDWARNNNVPPQELTSMPSFKKLLLEPPRTRPLQERKKDLDGAVVWMRNKGEDGNDEINDSAGELRKIDSMLPRKLNQSPEDRAEEQKDWRLGSKKAQPARRRAC